MPQGSFDMAPLNCLALVVGWLHGRLAMSPLGTAQCGGSIGWQARADHVDPFGFGEYSGKD